MRDVQCKGPWRPVIFQGRIEYGKNLILLTETTSHVRIRKVLWKRNDVFRSKAERCGPIGTGLVRSTCWTKDKVGIP